MRGKPPRKKASGATNRKRADEKKLAALREQAAEIGYILVPEGTSLPDEGDGAAEFSALGLPPINEADTALEWVRRVQLTATQIALTKPLTDALRERLKWAKDLSATIGMTFSRSAQEAKAARLERQLRDMKRNFGTAKTGPGAGVAKSPNARGVPRVVPPPPPDEEPPTT